jgi:integrase
VPRPAWECGLGWAGVCLLEMNRFSAGPALHVLRHTFCSRLAMRGAPAKAIQELAGHENLSTTQRYMNLSPAAKDAAISLLDEAASQVSGDILETEIAPKEKPGR